MKRRTVQLLILFLYLNTSARQTVDMFLYAVVLLADINHAYQDQCCLWELGQGYD